MRKTTGTVAVVLFLVMLYLFFAPPRLTFVDSPESVDCGSVASAGWPEASSVDDHGVQHLADDVPFTLTQDPAGLTGILRDCDQRRTTYTGFMALLAVPTVGLGVLSFLSPRKRKPQPRLREEAV